ncbi:hypothetical protein [Natrononativus amylolyticus]|uniref:hypothetical protein n=1 Tax=Natrononativus amylolyticus TaxID=2963434 RepID=UPI0020CF37C8|nr:hypothetical protein [Natrononativus amylolyticus]
MSQGERTSEGGETWARLAERLCFLYPPVLGVGAIGVVRELDPGVPGLQWGLVLFGTFGYTLLSLGLAVALFLDARRVRSRSEWAPSPWLNALFALLLAPVAGVSYLYRRHRRFSTPAGWHGWWLVIALSLGTTVFAIAGAIVAVILQIPGLLATVVGIAGAIAVGTFPIAIHQDAAYVSARGGAWQPNPAGYLGLAFLSLFVPVLQPVLAGYYLLRRRRASRRWP